MNPAPAIQIFKKRGRPPKWTKPMADLHVKIDIELFNMLDQYCTRCGTTKQYVVTQALYEWFNGKQKPNYYLQFKRKLLQEVAYRVVAGYTTDLSYTTLMTILAEVCVPHKSTLKRYLFKLQAEGLIEPYTRGVHVRAQMKDFQQYLPADTFKALKPELEAHLGNSNHHTSGNY